MPALGWLLNLGFAGGTASVVAVTIVESEVESLRLPGRLVDTTQTSFSTGLGGTNYDTEKETVNIDADGRPVVLTKISLTTI